MPAKKKGTKKRGSKRRSSRGKSGSKRKSTKKKLEAEEGPKLDDEPAELERVDVKELGDEAPVSPGEEKEDGAPPEPEEKPREVEAARAGPEDEFAGKPQDEAPPEPEPEASPLEDEPPERDASPEDVDNRIFHLEEENESLRKQLELAKKEIQRLDEEHHEQSLILKSMREHQQFPQEDINMLLEKVAMQSKILSEVLNRDPKLVIDVVTEHNITKDELKKLT